MKPIRDFKLFCQNSEIMKIEKQVCSLNQSNKLKELGIKQKTHFYWFKSWKDEFVLVDAEHSSAPKDKPNETTSAFTMSELGAMLNVTIDGVLPEKYNKKEVNAWFALNAKYYQTEADLRAGILIYLLETGLLAVSTCNSRLVK